MADVFPDKSVPESAPSERPAKYRATPEATPRMPPGVPYIVVNEAAERFSFYGMRGILAVFMTEYLRNSNGELAVMTGPEANEHYHQFVSAVYFLPLLGAIVADGLLGKYRTIMSLSIVYCFGHLALALDETRLGLGIGLTLIALGSGGIKPCVTANVGDQFGALNQHLLSKVFNWFYFSINLGAALSTWLTPFLLRHYGPHVAFGLPGVLMALATIAFWMGRYKFVHVPPGGWAFLRETFSGEGLSALLRLGGMVLFLMMFWAVFDQTGSEWVLQAKGMDRVVFGVELFDPSQVQLLNPTLVMAMIPLFVYGVYPAIDRYWRLTALRKIGLGLFVTVLAAAITWWIQVRLDAGEHPSILWQMLNYVILTSAEILVSITCLDFFYTQAPKRMKSIVMSVDMLAVSLGNYLTAAVNSRVIAAKGQSALEGANFFAFFTLAMLVTAVAFVVYAQFYRDRTYLQDAPDPGTPPAAAA